MKLALFGLAVLFAAAAAFAQTGVCPRPDVGATISEPPSLSSRNGVLTVNLSYNTVVDSAGRSLYCFSTPDQSQSPTLRVHPGDVLIINVQNTLPVPTSANSMIMATNASNVCGAAVMDASSVNIHFHGTNVAPTCHSDEVIHTLINAGQTFTYSVHIPADQPSGLYWYHPHVHGLSEAAVQGGASGAIVVEGIQNLQPAVAGLPERILLIRDQVLPANAPKRDNRPAWDLSVNYVPVLYPAYTPAVLEMKPETKEFWRVINAAADTILDLQLQYDGVIQTLLVAALDGVPTDSQNGSSRGRLIPRTHLLIPTAGRAEFIVRGPSLKVRQATLMTLNVPTGPDGDNDPTRPLITIHASPQANATAAVEPASVAPGPQRFSALAKAAVTARRTLYFSEDNPNSKFFITVDGATPTLFSRSNAPAIVTTQGSVEDWTIQNRAHETHNFHIHQIHFLLLERNGVPVAPNDRQMLDMIDIPFWSGVGPYPSVKLRLDFRGSDIGDFVYHCHILEHQDGGMMAIIRVLPATPRSGQAPSIRSNDADR